MLPKKPKLHIKRYVNQAQPTYRSLREAPTETLHRVLNKDPNSHQGPGAMIRPGAPMRPMPAPHMAMAMGMPMASWAALWGLREGLGGFKQDFIHCGVLPEC